MAKGVKAQDVKDTTTMVDRLVGTFERASRAELIEGLTWYEDALDFCKTLQAGTEYTLEQIVGMVSAISPRLGWGPNQTRARTLVERHKRGDGFYGLGLNSNFGLGYKILNDDATPEEAFTCEPRTKASTYDKTKRLCFYRNIMGERFADVTVDRWAVMGALGEEFDSPGRYYQEIESAYQQAAEKVGVPPREFQAVVWLVLRTETLTTTQLAAYEKNLAD
jgi:hypothetical protein